MDSITLELKSLLEKQLPFVIFRFPKKKRVHVFFQRDTFLYTMDDNYNRSGFIMAPFLVSKEKIFIPDTLKRSFNFTCKPFDLKSNKKKKSTLGERENFIALIKKAKDLIVTQKAIKIVVSRVINVKKTEKSVIDVFKKLLNNHFESFVYLWFHPKVGTWLGASPELLMSLKKEKLKTVSLAGTLKYIKKSLWTYKEREEQEIVTQNIIRSLQNYFKKVDFKKGKLKTFKTGDMVHLRTKITAFSNFFSIKKIIEILHPTAAVAGYPKDIAVSFIKKNENYKRDFYTGFLGVVQDAKNGFFFVNLRCANFTSKGYQIYAGAGITNSSDLEKEWLETEEKVLTIKNVL